MKFDNLFKLIVNENEDNTDEKAEFSELKNELSSEPENEEAKEAVGMGEDDELQKPMPESREEQVAYLIKTLPMLSRINQTKSEEELTKMANELIADDLFETIFNAHEGLTSEPVDEEDVPDEIQTDKPIRGVMGDEPDVPGLTEYEKEQRAMDRYREEEEGVGQDY